MKKIDSPWLNRLQNARQYCGIVDPDPEQRKKDAKATAKSYIRKIQIVKRMCLSSS
jgi:hypothetical protein